MCSSRDHEKTPSSKKINEVRLVWTMTGPVFVAWLIHSRRNFVSTDGVVVSVTTITLTPIQRNTKLTILPFWGTEKGCDPITNEATL